MHPSSIPRKPEVLQAGASIFPHELHGTRYTEGAQERGAGSILFQAHCHFLNSFDSCEREEYTPPFQGWAEK